MMEIRPILSAMMRNRTGALLIALQIAITLAVVINAVHMIQQRLVHMNRDSGMDLPNIIGFDTIGFGEDFNGAASIAADLDLLRGLPGVQSAAQISSFPLSNSGRATGFRASNDDDAERETANYYYADESVLPTLGVQLSEGRNFAPTEIVSVGGDTGVSEATFSRQVIITKAYAEKLFPDQSALGQLLYDGLGNGSEVIGVIEQMHGAWVGWDNFNQVMIQPKRTGDHSAKLIVRTEPGQAASLIPTIEETLAESNRQRIVRRVRTLEDVAARSYAADRAMAIVLSIVVVLLLLVTALGIVGLASFSVRQRTKQIGTRRAIGARKFDILRYFMMENWLMTSIGVVLGTALAIGLNYWLVTEFELAKLNLFYVPVGVLSIWALGLLAVLGPARRAASISPAIATRTV